ncbi:MAG: leucyl aminopeptidase [Bryobacteraceae bacterium]|nr:leucyl aminopeptidase [Bryobacteraceae bacterium]
MDTGLNLRPIHEVIADALVVVVFEDQRPDIPAAKEWIAEVYDSGEFKGEKQQRVTLHRPPGMKARRLVLAGAGKRSEFDPAAVRRFAGTLVRAMKSPAIKRIALIVEESAKRADAVTAAVEGALLGVYEPDRYRTDPKKDECRLESFAVVAPGGNSALEEAATRGRILGESQNLARDLANEPSNRLTPTALAQRAVEVAAAHGLKYEVLDRDRMRQLGMGALLGVAQGSAEPPALIVMHYTPEGGGGGSERLGLVGKGVTFDTGGISLKPSDKMDHMRWDMCGAAAVIGAMDAIAQLKPSIPVTALIPAVENMPGSRAQRPGDVVTTLSGKTVEVLNTDAEGRLILADALTYARRLGCTHLVDAATLTGAIVVALGNVFTGAFSNNAELLDKVMAAAEAEGEKFWRMPLTEDYKEQLKSPFADLPNIGTRAGGAITAAWFLKEFAEETPWVHLDIAGTAWVEEAKPFVAKGATGVCVRAFANLATGW